MDTKLFRSYMLLITFAVALVLAVSKIDLLAQGAGVLMGLMKPFFIGLAIAFVPSCLTSSGNGRVDRNARRELP